MAPTWSGARSHDCTLVFCRSYVHHKFLFEACWWFALLILKVEWAAACCLLFFFLGRAQTDRKGLEETGVQKGCNV